MEVARLFTFDFPIKCSITTLCVHYKMVMYWIHVKRAIYTPASKKVNLSYFTRINVNYFIDQSTPITYFQWNPNSIHNLLLYEQILVTRSDRFQRLIIQKNVSCLVVWLDIFIIHLIQSFLMAACLILLQAIH